ncbi:hypothetical protein BDN70DRAFT_890619 [Pholiota conissans]|uniref:Uncharacterized protein n=1 Tax=Pholiota conissans TaxID=109636 RepID=A0A9P5ZCR8_9AGAR|nr:hypothetical protein BDN70DRAFT_890619 [Pholiota conissans]
MTSLTRLPPRARVITQFIADCAREGNIPYFLGGANALNARGIIDRATIDVDFYIPPHHIPVLKKIVEPKLNEFLNEGFLLKGKTLEEKAQQTKCRIFKAVSDVPGENMKADVSENRSVLLPSAFTDFHGINVASVPLMVTGKISAISNKGRPSQSKVVTKTQIDLTDLVEMLDYLIEKGEIVPDELQSLLRWQAPPFTWKAFWAGVERVPQRARPINLEEMLRMVNIKKVTSLL